MAEVEPGLAAWLKSEGLYATATDADAVANWGDRASDSEFMSCLAFREDAVEEAARQLAFLLGPLAKDDHLIEGFHAGLVGQTIPIQGDRYGYETPQTVFVLRAVENEASATTTLTVLCRLQPSALGSYHSVFSLDGTANKVFSLDGTPSKILVLEPA